jgi:cell division initiation protein
MAITPIDILHIKFKNALRGYNKQQVDEFLQMVRESLEEALNAKAELQRKVECLEAEIKRVREIESTMTNALTLAQRTADELRTNAHRQAEMIMREAEQERVRMMADVQRDSERLRSEIALLQAARDRFEIEFRTMLTAYLEWLDRGLPTEIVADSSLQVTDGPKEETKSEQPHNSPTVVREDLREGEVASSYIPTEKRQAGES